MNCVKIHPQDVRWPIKWFIGTRQWNVQKAEYTVIMINDGLNLMVPF